MTSQPWIKKQVSTHQDKWSELEDQLKTVARTAKKQSTIAIDDEIPLPIAKATEPNCGHNSKPWGKPITASQLKMPLAQVTFEKRIGDTCDEPNKQELTVVSEPVPTEYKVDSDVAPIVLVRQTKTTVPKGLTPFKPGTSGNMKGRPKGSKHKISELARSVFAEDFAQHGQATVARLRVTDPASYLSLLLKLVPKEMILKQESEIDFAGMNEVEFISLLEEVNKQAKYRKMYESYTGAVEARQ
jgi:Family of unknown function (DUF5681)